MIISHEFGAVPFEGQTEKISDITSATSQNELGLTLLVGLETLEPDSVTMQDTDQALVLTSSDLMSMKETSFRALAPRLVLTPLISGDTDALDFARKLQSLGFAGRYRAVVSRLPNASVVIRDVLAAAPKINFGVTELAGMKPFERQIP